MPLLDQLHLYGGVNLTTRQMNIRIQRHGNVLIVRQFRTVRANCWSHSRHNLGKWYHYCDVEYKDPKDKDENGQPKQKHCKKGFDELIRVEFHRERHHNVRQCSIQCDYCDKPQQSVHRKNKRYHETTTVWKKCYRELPRYEYWGNSTNTATSTAGVMTHLFTDEP